MIPALIVGALTAWYLGLRIGAVAAVVTFIALLAAMFVPGLRLAVYALVIAWCAALYFFGPKMSKASGKTTMSNVAGSPLGQATAWAKKLIDQVRKS
jgi:hypothetical protein